MGIGVGLGGKGAGLQNLDAGNVDVALNLKADDVFRLGAMRERGEALAVDDQLQINNSFTSQS